MRQWARLGTITCLCAILAGCSGSVLPTVTVTVTVTGAPATAQASAGGAVDWASVVDRSRGAVFRIQTTNCSSSAPGVVATGLAIDEHLLVTAAHVVEYQRGFQVSSDASSGEAHVLGFDPRTDVALLWLDSSADSTLSFAETPPKAGDQVAVLGFPQAATDLQVATGAVTGLDGTGTVTGASGNIQREGMLVTDLATDPGYGGAPVLGPDGRVVGVASSQALAYSSSEGRVVPAQGTGYAVQPGEFADLLEQWRTNTSAVNTCDPDSVNHVIKNLDTAPAGAADALEALDAFWLAVNGADFNGAWRRLNARGQQVKGSFERWSAKMAGAQYSDGYLETARVSGSSGSATVVVNLTESTSAGETRCRVWRLTYALTDESDQWLVGPFSGRSIGRC